MNTTVHLDGFQGPVTLCLMLAGCRQVRDGKTYINGEVRDDSVILEPPLYTMDPAHGPPPRSCSRSHALAR